MVFARLSTRPLTQKQWARIKERVAEIDGKPVTEKVFVDRYWPRDYRGWYPPAYLGWTYLSMGQNTNATLGGIGSTSNVVNEADWRNLYQGTQQSGLNSSYNSTNAMNALGRAEAQAITQ